jgi:hypothetical protein
MTRLIFVLVLLCALPAFADDEVDVLESAQTRTEYPFGSLRLEKREGGTRAGALICGLAIRCKNADNTECRIQYKSEQVTDSIYAIPFLPGTSKVEYGSKGSLKITGQFPDERAAPGAVPAPAIRYLWAISAELKYDKEKQLFTFTQKQKAASTETVFNGATKKSSGGPKLADVKHCTNMFRVPDSN